MVLLTFLGVVALSTPGASAGFVHPPVGGVGTATGLVAVPLSNGTPLGDLASTFWGANVRPYYSLGSTASATYAGAGLGVVRWPGGAVADRLNVTSNRIYNDSGTWYSPPQNESQFVTWCALVHCQAIVGLPGEIDQPAVAANEVAYTENVLHFTPLYWEIGNEPSQWTHFGSRWSDWNSAQSTNATPDSYAALVHSYVAAIRTVDPQARILGLPGVGTGAWGEGGWISASVRLNGPNLSGVAIHVYPAGGVVSGAPTLGGFYSTLSGNSAFAQRIPLDRAAIAAACPNCSALPIIASEMGSGTQGAGYDAFMGGFADLPYLTTEVIEAATLNVSQIDLFAFQGSYGGSLLTNAGSPSLAARLYERVFVHLAPIVIASVSVPSVGGASAVLSRDLGGDQYSLPAANTNLSHAVTFVAKNASFSSATTGTLYTWTRNQSAPSALPWSGAVPPAVALPPESLGLLIVNASTTLLPPTHLPAVVPEWTGPYVPVTLAAGLVLAAPPSLGRPMLRKSGP